MTAPRICKDCNAAGLVAGRPLRPAPHPGPRCATHHREEMRRRRLAASGRHVQRTYTLTPDDYARLMTVQGNRCAICRRAQGNPNGDPRKRNLAVDHDHTCCPGPTSCGRCVRGLVCGPCNDMLAHARDDPEFFLRAVRYLREWPALAI